MKNIAILQPSELGSDFNFSQENGVWGVNFPAAVESDVIISQNTNNLIKVGTDGGAYVDASKLIAHALIQDNENQKIHLYRFQAGTVFNKLTATLVGSVDILEPVTIIIDEMVNTGESVEVTPENPEGPSV